MTTGDDERPSRRDLLSAAAVVAACAAATGLLLSGWTPGPGAPATAAATAGATAPPPAATPPPAPRRTVRTRTTAKPSPEALQRRASRQLFEEECGFCHTLAAAGTTGKVGPNLDKLHPSRGRILAAMRNGGRKTGLMPPIRLKPLDEVNLATFVADAVRR